MIKGSANRYSNQDDVSSSNLTGYFVFDRSQNETAQNRCCLPQASADDIKVIVPVIISKILALKLQTEIKQCMEMKTGTNLLCCV
jgi:hypothetical protein